jgi:hypothetical protein
MSIKESGYTSSFLYGVVPLFKERNNFYLRKVVKNPSKFEKEGVNVLAYSYGSPR